MKELGQLEAHHQEFEDRKVRIVVASIENQDAARATQKDFPHLLVLSDSGRGLSSPLGLIHPQSSPDGEDTSAPTTFLIDGAGKIRWTFRPDRILVRLSPRELLAAIDQSLPPG